MACIETWNTKTAQNTVQKAYPNHQNPDPSLTLTTKHHLLTLLLVN